MARLVGAPATLVAPVVHGAGLALRDAMVKPLVGYASRLRIPLIFNRVVDEPQFVALQQYDVRFVQGPLFTAHYHDRAV